MTVMSYKWRSIVLFGSCFLAFSTVSKMPFLTQKLSNIAIRNLRNREREVPLQLEDSSLKMHPSQYLRNLYIAQCHDETSTQEDLLQTLRLTTNLLNKSKDIDLLTAQRDGHEKTGLQDDDPGLVPCQYTFLDLGANIGDSLGKFIDSSFDSCPGKNIPRNPKIVNHQESHGEVHFYERENALVRSSKRILQDLGHVPEQYCYYGIEGNPRFTQQLHAMQRKIMGIPVSSKPLERVHFLTETVAAGCDGPTTLYLDTVNADRNFWGSSILSGHEDVRRSAKSTGGTVIQASVQGLTLSTLLKKTVKGGPSKGHVLIKMDIEGGEFMVLEEAYRSGTLCDYASSDSTIIHLILETHRPEVTGIIDFDLQHWRYIKNALTECGVIILKGKDAGR